MQQSESISKKIIMNRSIYKLTFTKNVGEINEIIGVNFKNINIKNNLKEALRIIRKRGKKHKKSRKKEN